MFIEKHNLALEFPEYKEQIRELKLNNKHFSRLFNEYNELDLEIIRIEEDIEVSSEQYLDGLKKQRLALKDDLYGMIKELETCTP